MASSFEVHVLEIQLTENIRRWIRNVLLTSDLPSDTRNNLLKYTTNRRSSDDKTSRTIPFELVKTVHGLQPDNGVPLHELLQGSEIHFPSIDQPPRNPQLEARIQKLKAEQSQRSYDVMTRNVKGRTQVKDIAEQSLGGQMKLMNNQILSMFNFVVTVAGSFAFAYKATEYSMEKPNFAVQLLSGLCVATVVFIADLYFLIKYSQ